jgi:hypothetical protein
MAGPPDLPVDDLIYLTAYASLIGTNILNAIVSELQALNPFSTRDVES